MNRMSCENHRAHTNGRVVRKESGAKEFLKVMLWGEEIGRLAWHENRKLAYFNYNPEFLRGNLDVAPLVASIRNPMTITRISHS